MLQRMRLAFGHHLAIALMMVAIAALGVAPRGSLAVPVATGTLAAWGDGAAAGYVLPDGSVAALCGHASDPGSDGPGSVPGTAHHHCDACLSVGMALAAVAVADLSAPDVGISAGMPDGSIIPAALWRGRLSARGPPDSAVRNG